MKKSEYERLLNTMRENNGLTDDNIIKLMDMCFRCGIRTSQNYVVNDVIERLIRKEALDLMIKAKLLSSDKKETLNMLTRIFAKAVEETWND